MISFEVGRKGLAYILSAIVLAAGISFGSGLFYGASITVAEPLAESSGALRVSSRTALETALDPVPRRQPLEIRRPYVPSTARQPRSLPNPRVYPPSSLRSLPALPSGRNSSAPVLGFRAGQRIPPTPYGDLIYQEARSRRLNPDLVAAVIWVESGFNPSAISHKGAIGLMQVIPATARRFGIDPDRLEEHLRSQGLLPSQRTRQQGLGLISR
jgi:soluble lytic murein transglycosylase-like protein